MPNKDQKKPRNDPMKIVAAVFDLKEASAMTSRPEGLRDVSRYLESFFHWLSDRLQERIKSPSLSSITMSGEGTLVVWERAAVGEGEGCDGALKDILSACKAITEEFSRSFSDQMEQFVHLAPLPKLLRCGVAAGDAGQVPLRTGAKDSFGYFGFCITLATRLQKLCDGVSLTLSSRLNLSKESVEELKLVEKVAYVSGIGEEKVLILKEEFDKLQGAAARLFVKAGQLPPRGPSEGLSHADALELADAINMRGTMDAAFLALARLKLKHLIGLYPDAVAILLEQAKMERIGNNTSGLQRAVRLLDHALELEPNYARVYFNRACYYSRLAERTDDTAERNELVKRCIDDLRANLLRDSSWEHWLMLDKDLEFVRSCPDQGCRDKWAGLMREVEARKAAH